MATAKKPVRAKRSPSDAAVAKILGLPLGEVLKFCDALVVQDKTTAEFIVERLQSALGGPRKPMRSAETQQPPADGAPATTSPFVRGS